VGKDAYYFKHDSNASNDPKMIAMLMRHGMEGYGRFWRLVEMLREQRDYRLPNTSVSFSALAKAWICTTDEAIEFAKSLEIDYELIHTDENFVWSDSLCRRMNVLDSIRSSRSEAAKSAAIKRWNASRTNSHASGIASTIKSDASATNNHASVKENHAILDILTRETKKEPFKGAPSSLSEPQEKNNTRYKSRQSPSMAELEKAGLIRAARESKRAGIPLLTIEKRALQEIGEEPPDAPESNEKVDDFPDDFPEAAT
jgi:hypothetical protein